MSNLKSFEMYDCIHTMHIMLFAPNKIAWFTSKCVFFFSYSYTLCISYPSFSIPFTLYIPYATQIGDAALSILHSMVSAHSDLDDAGEIVTPTPRVKRILSSPRCLPHIAQVIVGTIYLLCYHNASGRLTISLNVEVIWSIFVSMSMWQVGVGGDWYFHRSLCWFWLEFRMLNLKLFEGGLAGRACLWYN